MSSSKNIGFLDHALYWDLESAWYNVVRLTAVKQLTCVTSRGLCFRKTILVIIIIWLVLFY